MARRRIDKADVKKPEKEKQAEGLKLLADGRYQTPDGRVFDTLLKASKYLLTQNQ